MTRTPDHDAEAAPRPFHVSGFPSEARVFPVSSAELRVDPGEHPVVVEHRAEIEANWARETAANPALFNGGLIFQRQLSLAGDVLTGRGHVVPYATHLWWRRQTVREGGAHSFAWAVPVSSDGAVIAIRMGAQTANAGMVYCAAGSLEPVDIVNGRVDIDSNMSRELMEETGLDTATATAEPGYHGMFRDQTLLIARIFRFPFSADEMLERIRHHMLHDQEQEIAAALAIWNADPDAHRYNAFMPTLLDMVFARENDRRGLIGVPASGTLPRA